MTSMLQPVSMPPADFSRLLMLKFVFDERSVSRAAERLGMSQSAVSHALAKLREELGDPLFVRRGSTMVPTTRGEEVVATVRRLADELAALYRAEARFDPAEYRGTVSLGFSSLAPGSIAARIIERLRRAAPEAKLSVRLATSSNVVDLLGDGTIDLAIGRFALSSGNVLRRRLLVDRPVCLLRPGNELVGAATALDTDTYFALEHVDTHDAELATSGALDPEVQARAVHRRVRLTVPDVSWAFEVASSTELATTVPRSAAQQALTRYPLHMFEIPFETAAQSVDELWHERRNTDPLNTWLRTIVRAAAASLELATPPSAVDEASAA